MNNLLEFTQAVINNGGATFNLNTGLTPRTGYVVSNAGTEQRVPFNPDTIQETVREYVINNAEALSDEGIFLGGWVENGDLYLDLSQVITERRLAALVGLRNGQQAIFNLDENETVFLPQRRQTTGTVTQQRMYLQLLADRV